jgi:hypothetical protein
MWDESKLGSSVMFDDSVDLCVGLQFYPELEIFQQKQRAMRVTNNC